MRKAISYWAIRVAISGSPKASCCLLVQRGQRVEHATAAVRCSTPGGLERYSTGSPLERSADALVLGRQKAGAPQPRVQGLGVALRRPARVSTTNAGRSWFIAAQAVGEPGAHARPARAAGCRS